MKYLLILLICLAGCSTGKYHINAECFDAKLTKKLIDVLVSNEFQITYQGENVIQAEQKGNEADFKWNIRLNGLNLKASCSLIAHSGYRNSSPVSLGDGTWKGWDQYWNVRFAIQELCQSFKIVNEQ